MLVGRDCRRCAVFPHGVSGGLHRHRTKGDDFSVHHNAGVVSLEPYGFSGLSSCPPSQSVLLHRQMNAPNRVLFGLVAALMAVVVTSLPETARAAYLVTPSSALTSGNCNARPGQGNPGASYTIGSCFTVGDTALLLTALGVEDDNNNHDGGFGDGLVSSHGVSIWEKSTDTSTPLLATVTVPSGTVATYNDGFRYADLTTGLTLAAGKTYYIGAWFTDPIASNDTFYNPTGGDSTKFTFDSAVAVTGGAAYSTSGSFLAPACPTIGGNPSGGWAGASAQFTLVPEPFALSLLGLGVIGCIWRRKRIA